MRVKKMFSGVGLCFCLGIYKFNWLTSFRSLQVFVISLLWDLMTGKLYITRVLCPGRGWSFHFIKRWNNALGVWKGKWFFIFYFLMFIKLLSLSSFNCENSPMFKRCPSIILLLLLLLLLFLLNMRNCNLCLTLIPCQFGKKKKKGLANPKPR